MDFLGSEPSLVDTSIRAALANSLRCLHVREQYMKTLVYNIFIAAIIFVTVGGVLYFRYKGILTVAEKQRRSDKRQAQILEKIRKMEIPQTINIGEISDVWNTSGTINCA